MIRRPAIRALSPYLLTRSANLPRTTILAAVPCQSKNSTSSTSSLPPRPAACRKFSTATQRKDSATAAEPPSVAAQHGHAVSNPTLANIEKRWENMPPQEQAELWMALRDRMTVDWHDMTLQEKRACECFFPLLFLGDTFAVAPALFVSLACGCACQSAGSFQVHDNVRDTLASGIRSYLVVRAWEDAGQSCTVIPANHATRYAQHQTQSTPAPVPTSFLFPLSPIEYH